MFAIRKRSQLEKLISGWMDYKETVITRMGASGIGAAEEREFLRLKGEIAEDLAGLSWDLGMDQEKHAHFEAVTFLLNRYPTLYADQALDEQQRGEFEHNWHDHYLFFYQLKGVEGKPEADPTGRRGYDRARSARTKVVVLRVLLLVFLGLTLVRFLPWHRIGVGTSAQGYVLTVQDFVSQGWSSTEASDGPQLGGVFQPAMEKYGPEVTTVMVAVLLLAMGHLIFIRMK